MSYSETIGLTNDATGGPSLTRPGKDLGAALRAARARRRMTLRQLSEATGLSESFLSQFERGMTQGSIASLRLVAEALGVNLGDLFDKSGGGSSPRVLRELARPQLSFGYQAIKQLITPSQPENVEVFSVTFEIDGSTGDHQYTHGDSDEVILVQSGVVKLELAEDVFLLESGDSIVFRSSVPHRVANMGKASSTVLWIISPPTRPKSRGTDGGESA
jgi:transcriptional regulator with XRE-family HTH domain